MAIKQMFATFEATYAYGALIPGHDFCPLSLNHIKKKFLGENVNLHVQIITEPSANWR